MAIDERARDREILESLLDQYGMSEILDALSTICAEKAEHLRSNWQDESAAKDWDNAARQLDRIAGRDAFERISRRRATTFYRIHQPR